jgi:hypothetical protein
VRPRNGDQVVLLSSVCSQARRLVRRISSATITYRMHLRCDYKLEFKSRWTVHAHYRYQRDALASVEAYGCRDMGSGAAVRHCVAQQRFPSLQRCYSWSDCLEHKRISAAGTRVECPGCQDAGTIHPGGVTVPRTPTQAGDAIAKRRETTRSPASLCLRPCIPASLPSIQACQRNGVSGTVCCYLERGPGDLHRGRSRRVPAHPRKARVAALAMQPLPQLIRAAATARGRYRPVASKSRLLDSCFALETLSRFWSRVAPRVHMDVVSGTGRNSSTWHPLQGTRP